MRTLYEIDNKRISTGNSKQIGDKEGRQKDWLDVEAPPAGIAQRVGNTWVMLDAYPVDAVIVPASITPRQARLALFGEGLLDQVLTAINSMSEPNKSVATIEWEYASSINRADAWVSTLSESLGLTSDQLDDLFIVASGL